MLNAQTYLEQQQESYVLLRNRKECSRERIKEMRKKPMASSIRIFEDMNYEEVCVILYSVLNMLLSGFNNVLFFYFQTTCKFMPHREGLE